MSSSQYQPGSPSTGHTGDTQIIKYLKLADAWLLVAALLVAIGCASNTQDSSTGEYIDDTVITTTVKTAISGDPTLRSAETNVEIFKGVVHFSGFVSSQADIDRAVDLHTDGIEQQIQYAFEDEFGNNGHYGKWWI